MEPHPVSYKKSSTQSRWKAILFLGVLVGTLDILGATIVYQAHPAQIFKAVASGAFGVGTAFSGGATMVVWGIIFHYIIAFAWTVAFFFIYPLLPILWKNRFVTGTLYGVVIWVFMNIIVLPLSAITPGPFNVTAAAIGALILILAIGIPLAILIHRHYARTGILSQP
jgi:hypothetical protein